MRKITYGIIIAFAILSSVFLVAQSNRPEFFDIFGLGVFTFLTIVGYMMFSGKKKLPDWAGFTIFIIGILGLIVDGFIVFKTFVVS